MPPPPAPFKLPTIPLPMIEPPADASQAVSCQPVTKIILLPPLTSSTATQTSASGSTATQTPASEVSSSPFSKEEAKALMLKEVIFFNCIDVKISKY